MAHYSMDRKSGRNSLVTYCGIRFSGQYGVLAISLLYFFTILLAVFSASVNPLVLVAFLLAVPIWKIVKKVRHSYSDLGQMLHARNIPLFYMPQLASSLHYLP